VEALVVVETLLLVLVLVLVAGLLRSHAEILRRLGPPIDQDDRLDPRLPVPAARAGAAAGARAHDVAGATPTGGAAAIALQTGGGETLLAFLTSGCQTCLGFWAALAGSQRETLPDGLRVVVVTKDASHESPARLRELAPADVTVVLSSAAWKEYAVPGAPYFVYVDADRGLVLGEGVATGWSQLTSLLRDAVGDARGGPANPAERRAQQADRALDAAGIVPGHASLYPATERRS
jgi:hypothetical protein